MWHLTGWFWIFPLVFLVLMVLCMLAGMRRCCGGGSGCCCGRHGHQ